MTTLNKVSIDSKILSAGRVELLTTKDVRLRCSLLNVGSVCGGHLNKSASPLLLGKEAGIVESPNGTVERRKASIVAAETTSIVDEEQRAISTIPALKGDRERRHLKHFR